MEGCMAGELVRGAGPGGGGRSGKDEEEGPPPPHLRILSILRIWLGFRINKY